MMRSADIILVVSFSSLMTFVDLLPNVELGGTSWDGHEIYYEDCVFSYIYFNVLRYYPEIDIYIHIAPKNHAAWKMIRLPFGASHQELRNGVFPQGAAPY